ncbi:MAG: SUF system NifU family Fe-S cluster assembly protein [Actinomycetaceae bacterium]|nr:SUF system NifU family Fe-S cluster assembly protein [Actinomycetaceae bacterium]
MNELDQMYQQIILDAARERSGEGPLADAHGESFQVNPTCGDQAWVRVKLSEDGTSLAELAWEGQGCSISQASLSIMSDLVEGKTLAEIGELYTAFRDMMDKQGGTLTDEEADLLEDASAFEGVSKFPMRIKCALLGWMGLRDAIDQAEVK